jgi:hypothetical protein
VSVKDVKREFGEIGWIINVKKVKKKKIKKIMKMKIKEEIYEKISKNENDIKEWLDGVKERDGRKV